MPSPIENRQYVRQVFHNLISNAIKYTPSDGKGEVIVSINTGDDKEYVITVEDNGIGIPKDAQKRIFERFFRADNASKVTAKGTGLGLYVAQLIIETAGGRLWFSSTEGEGTLFSVALPIKGMQQREGDRQLEESLDVT